MKKPSPRAHLYRLTLLLIAGGAAFVAVRGAMVPDTWNSKRAFREASLVELLDKPIHYAGNDSCVGCHEDEDELHEEAMETLMDGPHAGISCESCHGPLTDHVRDNKKFADARTDYSRLACLTCHSNNIASPAWFPKFIADDEEIVPWREAELLAARLAIGKKNIYRHEESAHAKVDCTECHYSFHNPSDD